MSWWRRWLQKLTGTSEPTETLERTRSKEERERFWGEFRAGQREADERGRAALQRPAPVTK